MKLSPIIQVLLEITFVSVIHGNIVEVPQNTTSISGTDVTILCIVSRLGPTYFWYHGDTRIFVMDFEGTKEREPGTEEEYGDFSVVASPAENFSLIISSVQVKYEGTYVCEEVRSGGSKYSAELKVEVPTKMISLTCDLCDGQDPPSCPCMCSAYGGYPQSLTLNWTINDQPVNSQPATSSEDVRGTFNFTSDLTVAVSNNNALLKCSVEGYVNQEDVNDMYGDQVMAERELSSLSCTVDVAATDTSTEVQLNCSCLGYPVATEFQYYVQNGTEKIPVDSKYIIPCGVDTYFLCSGSNGIDFEDSTSPAVKYSCEDTTTPTLMKTEMPTATTTPTMTLMATSTPEPSSIVLIVVLSCFGGILVVGVAGGSVYWFCFRTPSDDRGRKKGSNTTVTASTNETTNSAAPVYGVVNKSTKKKSDNTDGNGVNSKLQSEPDQVEYAAVNKPKSDPQPAPRSSKPPGNNTEPEKVELQYADIDHSNRGRSNEIHQPADAPTEYATVQSVIV